MKDQDEKNKKEREKLLEKLGIDFFQISHVKNWLRFLTKYCNGSDSTEGACQVIALKFKDLIGGEVKGGWFRTDKKITQKDIEIRTRTTLTVPYHIHPKDSRKLSHFWLEKDGYIIEFTGEQFNRFLNKIQMEEIEIFKTNSKKGKRYYPQNWKLTWEDIPLEVKKAIKRIKKEMIKPNQNQVKSIEKTVKLRGGEKRVTMERS